jgi:4-amino-4-deoxy-L-arabinose transferase-like glycosyltransferase
MPRFESEIWNSRIRAAFWIIGILCGGIMAYTTRFFINGDAIVYVEMGEAFRRGDWSGLVNLTYSPGYPVLLGIAQGVLQTNPLNELPLLRLANFFCFVLTMGMCDLVMTIVKREVAHFSLAGETPLPLPITSALCYSMFLVASLVFVRIRLINPDMLIFGIVLGCMAAILWIRENPEKYLRYGILGIVVGIGYLAKSFFFPFSPIFFALAGLCSGSLKKALPRILVAALCMLLVSAPLITSLSAKLGRFTYGELGRHIYAKFISGKGEPIYPKILLEKPKTVSYVSDFTCTRPAGFDICYWHEGLKPDINMAAHLKVIPGNVWDIFEQTPWLFIMLLWFAAQWWQGSVRLGPIRPPSMFLLLMVTAVFGITFYSLVRMEPRYIAPYLFLGFVALALALRYPAGDEKVRRRTVTAAGLLIGFFLVMVGHSLVDQSIRGLHSTGKTLSYQSAYNEHLAVKDFLKKNGLKKGDYAGLVGEPPVYWGRMAGLKIVGEIENENEFIESSPDQRKVAMDALKHVGVKALIAKGDRFSTLASEGWELAPHTTDYYVLFLTSQAHGA